MRLLRSALVADVTSAAAGGIVVLEAPAGFGKSWLLRKVADADTLRLRGDLDRIDARDLLAGRQVAIDEAHLLHPGAIDDLVDIVETAPEGTRLMIVGRIIHERIHEVAQLVDGTIVDATSLRVTADEISAEHPDIAPSAAAQVVDVTGGCIRTIRAAFEQGRQQSGSNPVTLAARIVRDVSMSALEQLTVNDQEVVGLLARSPGIDAQLLTRLGGQGIIDRLVAAGIPIRRNAAGGLDMSTSAAFRAANVGRAAATQLAVELVRRDRPQEALSLLLDAGDAIGAAALVRKLSETLADTIEPRLLLGVLGRLGSVVEHDPTLLLVRARAHNSVGRLVDSTSDIDRAAGLVGDSSPPLRRRVQVEVARARLTDGDIHAAVHAAERAIAGLEPGEDRTYARAHEILAECASTSEARAELQRAAESYQTAIAGWEACGEHARARSCRRSLAMGVLVSLGRIDESLAQLAQLLNAPDLTDAERSWTELGEGFVLVNGGRLDAADGRFQRTADIGVLHDNPRLIAASAWGRALVSARRGDLDETLHWIGIAENTMREDDDDLLGVQFYIDVSSVMLGPLGELDLAERYLAKAEQLPSAFGQQTALARFLLDARNGKLGDVEAQLEQTAPAEWWRVQLVAAHAAARAGDLERARSLTSDAEHELLTLGFEDASTLGERREQQALWALLRSQPVGEAVPVAAAPSPARREAVAAAAGPHVLAIGSPMSVRSGDSVEAIPPGNPQRLVGVVVANGGTASFDQLSEAIWPGDDIESSRTRLRNVLLRLRKATGDIVVRSGSGVRLAPGATSDLQLFERLATDALTSLRADPELAGHLAEEAVEVGSGPVFADFEYEEWAMAARHTLDQKMIALLDVLSVQAEDLGNLPAAQAYAERALRLDRYTDSRYVRLSELLIMQDRRAAAAAVLEDADAVARELNGGEPATTTGRPDQLVRRAASTR